MALEYEFILCTVWGLRVEGLFIYKHKRNLLPSGWALVLEGTYHTLVLTFRNLTFDLYFWKDDYHKNSMSTP